MAILLTCTCQKRLRVKDELDGKRIKCPACGKTLTVPTDLQESATPDTRDLDKAGKPTAVSNHQIAPGPIRGWPRRHFLWIGIGGFAVLLFLVGGLLILLAPSDYKRIQAVVEPFLGLEAALLADANRCEQDALQYSSRGEHGMAQDLVRSAQAAKYQLGRLRPITVVAAATALADEGLDQLPQSSMETIATTLNSLRARLSRTPHVLADLNAHEVRKILTTTKGSLKAGQKLNLNDFMGNWAETANISTEKVGKHLQAR